MEGKKTAGKALVVIAGIAIVAGVVAVGYYQEERRAKIELRQELADSLQIPLNALRIRAHRIRARLEQCITQCMETP